MRLTALAGALLLATGAGAGVAAPNDVIADYFVDGQLNGVYSVEDLREALAFAQARVGGGAQYSAFADIVSEAITQDLAGTSGAAAEQLKEQDPTATPRPTPPPDPTATAAAPPPSDIPTPPPSDPSDQLPAAVPIMGFVALGLVAIGSFAAVWRRRRRR